MPTLVGTQRSFLDALEALRALELDAAEAYRAAIARLGDASDKEQLRAFSAEHERHAAELSSSLSRFGRSLPSHSEKRRWLTKGKLSILGLAGSNAVLLAMKTNEEHTFAAYERMLARDDVPAGLGPLLERALADEARHKSWLEARVAATSATTFAGRRENA